MNTSKIPAALCNRPQWVMWKNIIRGDDKTKVPFQPDGTPAKSNDPSTWTTLEACASELTCFSGVGFMFSPDDAFVGIDLDGCRNPETGEVAGWAREIIQAADSYTEVSPSQTGVKIFVTGEWKHGGKKCEIDSPAVSDKTPGIEVYAERRYFAVTGQRVAGVSVDVEQRQAFLDSIYKAHFAAASMPASQKALPYTDSNVIDRARKYVSRMPAAVSGNSGHNATFHVACVLVLGFGLGQDEALAILREYNERCDPPWNERELQHKVASADQQTGERNYLRDAEPAAWQSISVPTYREQPAKPGAPQRSAIKVQTLEEAARRYQETLFEEGNELITTGLSDLDYAIGGGYAPGEMVVVAARPSHGKSAIALQMVHAATERKLPAFVLSQEMSALAVGKRVSQFVTNVPESQWRNEQHEVAADLDFHFKQRAPAYLIESVEDCDRAVEEITKAVEQRDVKVACVDYAQMLTSQGSGRYEQVTNTSLKLKKLATDTGVSLIVLCQLNRAIENRSTFMPLMSDLKDSGQFEQDADVILFLVWPHRIDSTKEKKEYCVFVAKNRNRAINQSALRLEFNPQRQRLDPEMRERVSEFDDFNADDDW